MLVVEGVVRRGETLVFAMHAGKADRAPGTFADLTLWECFVSSFHLDDVVPVEVGSLDDGEPVISEQDQVLMLRHGLGFALEVVRLVGALIRSRCAASSVRTAPTARFGSTVPGPARPGWTPISTPIHRRRSSLWTVAR